MKVFQQLFHKGEFILQEDNEIDDLRQCRLVLGFGERKLIEDGQIYHQMKQQFPAAEILLCSTAGEILGNNVYDETIAITALSFEKTRLKTISLNAENFPNSFEAGKALMHQLEEDDLTYIFLLSDALIVNSSQLVIGMEENNKRKVLISGGLAADGQQFASTLVGLNGSIREGTIAAIGFYGKDLLVSNAYMGGWDEFGPERTITRSIGKKLYEIDHSSALELYKIYLGDYVHELPQAAVYFPISVKLPGHTIPLVRSILSIDEKDRSMGFSGDVPEGSLVRFMKVNFDKLIDAASTAAEQARVQLMNQSPKLALIISCVGRKVILERRIEEEIDIIAEVFGRDTYLTGFYSYGEISPQLSNGPCELHNQTMTVTLMNEL